MYFAKLFLLGAAFSCLLAYIQITEAVLEKEENVQDVFTYFWEIISKPENFGSSSTALAQVAAEKYREMANSMSKRKRPRAMTALWLPNNREIILASSARGEEGSKFAYHPNVIPEQLKQLLQAAASQGVAQDGWATDAEHHKGGACGEIVTMAKFFERYPNKDIRRENVKFVTVGGNPLRVKDACEEDEVSVSLRRRQDIPHMDLLESRQDSPDDFLNLTNFKFECIKGIPPSDDSATGTTISPDIATSVSVETVTDTSVPTFTTGGLHLDLVTTSIDDDNEIAATTMVSLVTQSSNPTSTPDPQNLQIAPNSGKPAGNAPENSPQNPPDGSGTNTNPQDPYANSGPGIPNPPKRLVRSMGRRFDSLLRRGMLRY
ncbi:hypothetical protein ACLMJK_000594 [Lecanora helva]